MEKPNSLIPSISPHSSADFNSFFIHVNTQILSSSSSSSSLRHPSTNLKFASTSISLETSQSQFDKTPSNRNSLNSTARGRGSHKTITLFKTLSVFERALIGAGAGGIAGAFTYVCLHPLDTIKTKLQTKGASKIYENTFDAIVKTFQSKGILGFYSGVSAVIVGSTASSAIYFGTCEFGKSVLSKLPNYPPVLIPPTAGAMGNLISSAIMVPKELITQRMQTGAKGRSWEVLLRILEKDGILGLYAGYSATLLRNLPAGVLSYSSFEYLKAAVLIKTKQANLEPLQSVCCGALAGGISASLTTPLDVVKTRLMTQVHSEAVEKIAFSVSETVKQILKEEGWVGFTRGMGPRVVHSACFSAIGYFAFETARLTILHEYLRRKELEDIVVPSGITSST
ncbi:protein MITOFERRINLIKE 1, chloroplastic [Cynara cardunculus var. scolymus]|uniref:Mitochondrial carrier domain-containing protein n=1 Tax=Cynara cardunculus var. scolymus TaxID=59895 RepID=A0A118K495_CYNCS|nr:protein MITOFERRINLIKE 1, chloroplastic [Cynara cardunculus var. scolymus]KVI07201.1 Mitochondrial carrier domain-containing protein [Cynara cardunculus var. scolymus]